MEEGHQSYAMVEKLVAETAKLRTDAERAALQFANVQAAMQAPSNLNLNGHVTAHPSGVAQHSAHATMSTSSASPPASTLTMTNGSASAAARLPKQSTPSKNASAPHVNNPVCDNCRLAGNVLCVRAAHPHHRRCTYCFENDTRCSFKESKAAAAAENGEPIAAPAVRKPRASQQAQSAVPTLVPVQATQPNPSAIPVQNAPAPPASAPPTTAPARQPKRKREPGTSEDSDEEMGQPAPYRRTPPAAPPFAAAVPMAGVQAYGQTHMPPPQPQVTYQPQVHQYQQPQPVYQPPPQRRAPSAIAAPIERRQSQAVAMPQPQPRSNGHNSNDLQRRVEGAQNLIRTIGFLFQQLDDQLGGIASAVEAEHEQD
ncbi:hypothetical protein PENSPDRAFT_647897 [Peniophora sp. CONT]|nr:hypothetical protein PENSPDRAFT_647897 [Peniophora sp. CONT]